MVNDKDINRNLLWGNVINHWLFKDTYIICSERWPIFSDSLLHRLPYAIYAWLFTGLHIDLKCNEQNNTKMSQQSHMFYLFFWGCSHRLHFPRVKYYRHSKKLLWTGWNTWVIFSTVSLTKSFNLVMFILLQCNHDYYLSLFLWWLAWVARYTE